ncbi:MAG: hypothetical protein J0I06_15115 [Planctomycetes bacterium]|nr:hypothetical protein [Planctomycetota bacterium]
MERSGVDGRHPAVRGAALVVSAHAPHDLAIVRFMVFVVVVRRLAAREKKALTLMQKRTRRFGV